MSTKTSKDSKKVDAVQATSYYLVKGEYTAEEALDITNDLFTKKINFHNQRSFSELIRFGKIDSSTDKRIMELKDDKEKAASIVKEAEKSGKKVRIVSEITIEILEE